MTVLSRSQAAALLESVDRDAESGARDYALLTTLLHCVLRRSEAASMDIEHLRFVSGHWLLDLPSTKGGAGQYVKVPKPVYYAIQFAIERYPAVYGPVWRSFSNNSKGARLSDRSIYRIVSRYAAQSGISETVGAHTLRHTGCTLAIEAGASVQQVQTHARHKNLETTMMYVHQRDKLADSAADYIGLDGMRGEDAEAANPGRDSG
ncbi:MAG: tyrosine-type recombinase/integrase [Bacteroidota bacterium]